MIFRRGKNQASGAGPDAALTADDAAIDADDAGTEATGTEGVSGEESLQPEPLDGTDLREVPQTSEGPEPSDQVDWDALDDQEWRESGPFDISEVELEKEDEDVVARRIDLGSLILTGFEEMELRLQVAEETQQIASAIMIKEDSALEVAVFAAPRSGGYWAELRGDIMQSAEEAGGSATLAEGPYGTELRRLLPVTTPDGEQGYQPSRMWVAQGPRWLLRGVIYGQAAVVDGLEPPVAQWLDSFRKIIVRRGEAAKVPGDLLPLTLPEGVVAAAADD